MASNLSLPLSPRPQRKRELPGEVTERWGWEIRALASCLTWSECWSITLNQTKQMKAWGKSRKKYMDIYFYVGWEEGIERGRKLKTSKFTLP